MTRFGVRRLILLLMSWFRRALSKLFLTYQLKRPRIDAMEVAYGDVIIVNSDCAFSYSIERRQHLIRPLVAFTRTLTAGEMLLSLETKVLLHSPNDYKKSMLRVYSSTYGVGYVTFYPFSLRKME
jgi:hypothetical protein